MIMIIYFYNNYYWAVVVILWKPGLQMQFDEWEASYPQDDT